MESGRGMSGPALKNAFIDEIESALRGGAGDKRTRVLMSVTDLFIDGSEIFGTSNKIIR
jgi:hypothetical protein